MLGREDREQRCEKKIGDEDERESARRRGKEWGIVNERKKEGIRTWERRERVSGMGTRTTEMYRTVGQRGRAVRSPLVAGDRAGGVWCCDVKDT